MGTNSKRLHGPQTKALMKDAKLQQRHTLKNTCNIHYEANDTRRDDLLNMSCAHALAFSRMLEIDTENRRRSLKYLESPCSFLLTLSRISFSFKCAAKKSACPKTSCREKRCRCRCQTACVEGCEYSSVGRKHVEIVVVQLRAAHLVGTVKAQGDVFIMNILQLSLAGPQATSAPRRKIIMQPIL